MKRAPFTISVLIFCTFLIIGWQALTHYAHWKVRFADSNFQANRIRLQSLILDAPAPVILAGSSVTARLVPAYFTQTSFPRVTNLGLDGCVVAFALEIIAERPLTEHPIIIVEQYSMLLDTMSNEETTRAAITPANLRLPALSGSFRADVRPTALIYSALKEQRDRKGGFPGPKTLIPQKIADLTQEQLKHLDRSRNALRALQKKGARLVFMRIPCGETEGPDGERAPDFFTDLAAELDSPVIDIPALMRKNELPLRYTDGLHLVSSSAQDVCRLLAVELESVVVK
jgi:predicted Rdx family selenoprotein